MRYRAASELREAGFWVGRKDVWKEVRNDWRKVFSRETWKGERAVRRAGFGALPIPTLGPFVPAFRRLVLSILIVLKIDRDEKCGWNGLKEIERRAGGKWVDLLWIALVTSLISLGVFLIPSLIPGIPKSDVRTLRIDVVNLFLLLILNKYFNFFHEEKLPVHSVPV